jgi:hypothetical protein
MSRREPERAPLAEKDASSDRSGFLLYILQNGSFALSHGPMR